jgi:hypothetical protein
MKHLLTILLLAACAATGYGQTIKTLGYNTTNGQVVYSGTNPLTFTNAPAFTAAAQTRTNLGLGATAQTIFKVMTNDLSITNQTNATTITDLTFDTEADARYVVTFYPITMSPANSTLLAIVASNSTVYGFWNGFSASFASINELTNAATFTASTNGRGALQVFYVEGGTNAGSISATFQSSVATNTNTIKAGSFLRADKMP